VRYGSEPMEPFALTIDLAGEWDLSRGNELRPHLQRAASHPRVVFDLTKVTYIDSNCIGMLMRMRTQRMAKGYPPARLVVTNVNLLRVLLVAAADVQWPVFETVDEALRDWKETARQQFRR